MWAVSLSRGLAVITAGLLSVSLVAALVHSPSSPSDSPVKQPLVKAPPREVAPLFAKTEQAKNPTRLVVIPDEHGLRGWIAGEKNFAGTKVSIRAAKEYEATIGEDNTFTWAHTSAKPLPVTVVPATDGTRLSAKATLPAQPTQAKQTAFIITDRSAYRPGHTLKFVAYVHETDDGIDFKPLANQPFSVDLTSETQGTRAVRLKLRSDAVGRLTGQYTFTDADSLDHYRLTVLHQEPTRLLEGSARVMLGEYRKTKVALKLKGDVKDGKLVLTFDARDYLDRPVPGTSATWSAVVSKTADVEKLALDPMKFVVSESGPPSIDDFNALPDDERLLTLANGISAMSFAGFGARAVATREGKVEFSGQGEKPSSVSIDLWPEWMQGQHSVTVNATFLDETGRENHAIGTFSLTPVQEKSVLIATSKQMYSTGEKVPVTITPVGIGEKESAATTIIVMRLEASPSILLPTAQAIDEEGNLVDNTRIPALSVGEPSPKGPESTKNKTATESWKSFPVGDPVKRSVLTAIPAMNGKASIDLKRPGAYKLLAVSHLADGTVLQAETGVVVKSPAKLPGVVLQLDSRELPAGSHLAGTVHTRFAGAKLLLTLRDASGVKLMKPLTAGANGMVRFNEVLPPNLRYGCAVSVQYVESATITHVDLHDIFVIPTDRTITITTATPDTVDAGAEVKLNFQVNRQEEVDLVVSVFDESLLGVSGDLSGNIRDFYLADARGQGRAARDLTATRLGNVKIADLIAKAEKLLKDPSALAKEPGLDQRLQALIAQWNARRLSLVDAVTLVRLTGFEVYLAQPIWASYGHQWTVPKSARLVDLLHHDAAPEEIGASANQYLSATVINNTVLIGLAGRNHFDPWIAHRGNFYQYAPVPGFAGPGMGWNICGGFNCNGFQFSGFSMVGNYGFGVPGTMMGNVGFHGVQMGAIGLSGFNGWGMMGMMGMSGGMMGMSGGMMGMGGGGLPGGNMSFSQPIVGGQMGMSFGFNRDFGATNADLNIGDNTVRRDFADSAFWTTTLRTDKNGKASTSFKMPDSLTNWRVQVTAISPKMHVGATTSRFKSSRPVMIWPMLPRAFTEGDVVNVFGTVHNLTDQEQNIRVHLKAENGEVLSQREQIVKVPAKKNVPVYWTYRAGKPGMTDLLMSAQCDAGKDASLKKLPVVAATVPERLTASGIVGKDDLKITLPEDYDPKTARVQVTVAPTLAADLADTLPYLVDYPYGCVEQTMSRFLPALRVAHILQQSGISSIQQLEEKLPKVVEMGQKRLIALQQQDGGWGWQGTGTTHELMTPYALFGLIASEEAGYPCPNPTAIPRGMTRLKQYLDNTSAMWDLAIKQGWNTTFSNRNGRRKTEINDVLFCLWVATMSKKRAEAVQIVMDPWFDRIEKTAGQEVMSSAGFAYALELAVKYDRRPLADMLAKKLHDQAEKSGDRIFWKTAGFSNWSDNPTEVTATVMKALVAHDPNDALIPGILAYFHSTKRGGQWNSTKDTASVLYALCDYLAATKAGPAAAGIVKIALNGTEIGNVKLDSPASKTVKTSGPELKAGENVFAVNGAANSGGALVRVQVSFTRKGGKLSAAREHGVEITRTISLRGADGQWRELESGASVPVGSYLKIRVKATPKMGILQYFLIESPKPTGFETIAVNDHRFPLSPDALGYVLREDREAMTCFHYQSIPAATTEFVVMAEFAGTFAVPPARGELMYHPTTGGHSSSFVLKVTPKP